MLRFVALFRRKVLQFGLLAGLAGVFLFLEGCYYMQAIRGHSDIMGRRRIVSEVIEDKASPEGLRTQLTLVHTARDFSIGDLFLPDNESYRSYADLERDYVVWNVIAAPEFSLEPKTWCYPVAGCAAYRGYFSESSARELEVKLRRDGYDVIVGGVSAYSTRLHVVYFIKPDNSRALTILVTPIPPPNLGKKSCDKYSSNSFSTLSFVKWL